MSVTNRFLADGDIFLKLSCIFFRLLQNISNFGAYTVNGQGGEGKEGKGREEKKKKCGGWVKKKKKEGTQTKLMPVLFLGLSRPSIYVKRIEASYLYKK